MNSDHDVAHDHNEGQVPVLLTDERQDSHSSHDVDAAGRNIADSFLRDPVHSDGNAYVGDSGVATALKSELSSNSSKRGTMDRKVDQQMSAGDVSMADSGTLIAAVGSPFQSIGDRGMKPGGLGLENRTRPALYTNPEKTESAMKSTLPPHLAKNDTQEDTESQKHMVHAIQGQSRNDVHRTAVSKGTASGTLSTKIASQSGEVSEVSPSGSILKGDSEPNDGNNASSSPCTATMPQGSARVVSQSSSADNVGGLDLSATTPQSGACRTYKLSAINVGENPGGSVLGDCSLASSCYFGTINAPYIISGGLTHEQDGDKQSNLFGGDISSSAVARQAESSPASCADSASVLVQQCQVRIPSSVDRGDLNPFDVSLVPVNAHPCKPETRDTSIAGAHNASEVVRIDHAAEAIIAHAAAEAAAAADAAAVVGVPASATDRPRPFPCDSCGRSFLRTGDLNRHKATVHQKIRKAKCDICGGTYGHRGDLNRHITRVHDKGEFRQCPMCGATFQSQAAFSAHQKIHVKRAQNGMPFPCQHCRKAFATEAERDIHCAQNHSVLKVKCNHDGCNEAFPSLRSLRTHTQAEHTSIARCLYCTATFRLVTELSEHIAKRHPETGDTC